MKKIYVSLIVLLLSSLCNIVNAQAFVKWTFNEGNDNDPGSGTLLPALGSGSMTFVGATQSQYAGGSPNSFSDNSLLVLYNYPAFNNAIDIGGVEFSVSTIGKTSIVIAWYQIYAPVGSKYIQLQYSIDDGVNWLVAPLTTQNTLGSTAGVDIGNDVFYADASGQYLYHRVAFGGNVEERSNLKFRIVAVHGPGTNPSVYIPTDPDEEYDGSVSNYGVDEVTVGANNITTIYHDLSVAPFFEDWADENAELDGLLRPNDWNYVPSIIGYTGEGLTGGATGVDPRTINSDPAPGLLTPHIFTDINTSPDSYNDAGFAEFTSLAFANSNPTIAFRGAGAVGGALPYHAPYLVVHLNTTGRQNVQVNIKIRDIDGTRDATQPLVAQYRVGSSGSWEDIPGFYAPDVTYPFSSTVIPVGGTLPPAANDKPRVQIRIMTTDSPGADAWIGIDDIEVTQGEVLPLQLANFTAAVINQQVQLNWQTTNEINVHKFEIESSTDGNSYSTIGTVAANNQAANTYSFTDNLSTANTYYRLKMIDKDGSYSYSKVVLVKGNTASAELTVYPNPVSSNTLAVSHAKATINASLSLYTMSGALVQQQTVPANSVNSTLNVSTVAKGNYVLVYNNGKEQTKTTVTIAK